MQALLLCAVVLAVTTPSSNAGDAATATSDAFVVVVHRQNPVRSLSAGEVARLFLKATPSWPDGEAVVPVDQLPSSAARLVFTRSIFKRTVSAIRSYWQQQIFAGKGVPPPEKRSDQEIVAFVAATPGAIGYVAAGTDVARVRALPIQR